MCVRWLPLVCESSWLPHLSHSSQDKAERQGVIRRWQEVSDECGSGVVRVVQEAQSIPGVCSLCAVDRGV